MHSNNCLNCENTIQEQDNYCRTCGQTVHLHRLTLGHLLHDGIHFFLHADKSLFTLAKTLAVKTGTVAREFVEGKRKRYYAPLNFFLVVIGLVVLSMSVFHMFENQTASLKQQYEAITAQIKDPAIKAKVIGIMERQAKSTAFVKKYNNILSMVAMPFTALLFSLFYMRGKYTYAEHLTANLYCSGFTSLVFALVVIPIMSYNNMTVYFGALIGYMLFELTYRSIFYYRFMNRAGAGAIIKAVAVSLFVQITWAAITVAAIYWYIKSGMSGLLH
jgi:hypothetical protein